MEKGNIEKPLEDRQLKLDLKQEIMNRNETVLKFFEIFKPFVVKNNYFRLDDCVRILSISKENARTFVNRLQALNLIDKGSYKTFPSGGTSYIFKLKNIDEDRP